MSEEIIFKRRNRLKKHFVNVSNVLLYGYKDFEITNEKGKKEVIKLTDAAKITYQVIDSFDWEDKETGDSKGYVFPAAETIANIRGISERTIRRHVEELIKVGLLTRIRRRNKSSVLYIEDISEQEIKKYIDTYVERKNPTPPKKEQGRNGKNKGSKVKISTKGKGKLENKVQKSRTDKNVRSQSTPERTKMSVAYKGKKENELIKQNKINVNEVFNKNLQKREGTTFSMGELMQKYKLPKANGKSGGKPDEILKRDSEAEYLATELNDWGGLGCYRVIVEQVPKGVRDKYLGIVKETGQTGNIRKSKAALYVSLVKQYADEHQIDLGFQTLETVPK